MKDMKRMKMNLILAIAALGLASSANAQAAKADPATLQSAAALVAQLGVKAKLQQQMAATVSQMRSGAVIRSMLAQQPGFIPAYQANKAKFDPVLAKAGAIQAEIAQGVINQNINGVINAATQAYARQYTKAELDAILAFYRSPAGQAVIRKEPIVASAIGQATGQMIGAKIDAAMNANAKRLTDALAPLNSNAQAGRKP